MSSAAQTLLLPGDDPAEYNALLAELTEFFAPQELIKTRLASSVK
jgi:hypothetical protein